MHAILHLHIILILLDINSILYYDIILKLYARTCKENVNTQIRVVWPAPGSQSTALVSNIADESEITQKLHIIINKNNLKKTPAHQSWPGQP